MQNKQQEQTDLLNTDEAAGYIQHSARTLIRWRNDRIGPPFIKCGRKVLYRRRSLDNWLEQRERVPVREVS